MKTFNRHSSRRIVPVGLALLSLLAAGSASAADEQDASCQRETRRVTIWPHSSPKAPQQARFEQREVLVCNGKVVAQPKRDEASQARRQP